MAMEPDSAAKYLTYCADVAEAAEQRVQRVVFLEGLRPLRNWPRSPGVLVLLPGTPLRAEATRTLVAAHAAGVGPVAAAAATPTGAGTAGRTTRPAGLLPGLLRLALGLLALLLEHPQGFVGVPAGSLVEPLHPGLVVLLGRLAVDPRGRDLVVVARERVAAVLAEQVLLELGGGLESAGTTRANPSSRLDRLRVSAQLLRESAQRVGVLLQRLRDLLGGAGRVGRLLCDLGQAVQHGPQVGELAEVSRSCRNGRLRDARPGLAGDLVGHSPTGGGDVARGRTGAVEDLLEQQRHLRPSGLPLERERVIAGWQGAGSAVPAGPPIARGAMQRGDRPGVAREAGARPPVPKVTPPSWPARSSASASRRSWACRV